MNRDIAAQVHHIPARAFAEALPHWRPFSDHYELRREFAGWVMRQRQQFQSWQQAWNAWTGATPTRAGRVAMHVTCPDCKGRLFSVKRGIPGPCMTCMGRRRVYQQSAARWVKE
jgi:hypothetical protein